MKRPSFWTSSRVQVTCLNCKECFKKEATGVTGLARRFSCSGRMYNLTHDYPDKSRGVFKSTSSTHGDFHRPIPRNGHRERIGWYLIECPSGFLGNHGSNAACHWKQSPATRKPLTRFDQPQFFSQLDGGRKVRQCGLRSIPMSGTGWSSRSGT